ncbi:hypothetical protein B7463_g3845, partial [Scytalidium lignicola]
MAAPLTTYGPHETCTLDTCDVRTSLYGYRPSLSSSVAFIVFFSISLFIHTHQGVKWRTWGFLTALILGCVSEIIGYGGRVMMWNNPFSFPGFMIQIVCITIAPAFFSAAIYLTLSKIIMYLSLSSSRFPPQLYYWIFVPCDIVSLALQATGGSMSSSSTGSSAAGVNIALAGLSFQVFTLTIFILLALDYGFRYRRDVRLGRVSGDGKSLAQDKTFRIFVAALSLSIVCILIRCIYRIDELSDGYNGPLIHNQGLFIGLEGVMIVIAVFALNVAHPGPVFSKSKMQEVEVNEETTVEKKVAVRRLELELCKLRRFLILISGSCGAPTTPTTPPAQTSHSNRPTPQKRKLSVCDEIINELDKALDKVGDDENAESLLQVAAKGHRDPLRR